MIAVVLVSCLINSTKKFRMDFVARLGETRSRTGSTATRSNDVSRRKTPELFDGIYATGH